MRALRRTANGAVDVLASPTSGSTPRRARSARRRAIELTRTEFSLLELFLLNPRQVLTRSLIFERVWGYDFGFGSNSLDVYIGYLRRKTEQGAAAVDPDDPRRRLRAARHMSFRTRLVLISALWPAAAAVVVASALTYVLVRDELRGQVDEALRGRAATTRLGSSRIPRRDDGFSTCRPRCSAARPATPSS